MRPFLLFKATMLLLPQSVQGAFQNPRIVPQVALPGEPVVLIIEVTNPDILGIGGFPNIVIKSAITRQTIGNEIQLLVMGLGQPQGIPDQGDVVVPIGSFLEPGSYTIEMLFVSSAILGSRMDFSETLGFTVVAASIPTLTREALLFLILCVLLIGAVAWRESFS